MEECYGGWGESEQYSELRGEGWEGMGGWRDWWMKGEEGSLCEGMGELMGGVRSSSSWLQAAATASSHQ